MPPNDRDHAVSIPAYPGQLSELAVEVGRMRYDAVAHFLNALAAELDRQSVDDVARGRVQLARRLKTASSGCDSRRSGYAADLAHLQKAQSARDREIPRNQR